MQTINSGMDINMKINQLLRIAALLIFSCDVHGLRTLGNAKQRKQQVSASAGKTWRKSKKARNQKKRLAKKKQAWERMKNQRKASKNTANNASAGKAWRKSKRARNRKKQLAQKKRLAQKKQAWEKMKNQRKASRNAAKKIQITTISVSPKVSSQAKNSNSISNRVFNDFWIIDVPNGRGWSAIAAAQKATANRIKNAEIEVTKEDINGLLNKVADLLQKKFEKQSKLEDAYKTAFQEKGGNFIERLRKGNIEFNEKLLSPTMEALGCGLEIVEINSLGEFLVKNAKSSSTSTSGETLRIFQYKDKKIHFEAIVPTHIKKIIFKENGRDEETFTPAEFIDLEKAL
jgi:hypothetical protein